MSDVDAMLVLKQQRRYYGQDETLSKWDVLQAGEL